jgi:hypothetical protein
VYSLGGPVEAQVDKQDVCRASATLYPERNEYCQSVRCLLHHHLKASVVTYLITPQRRFGFEKTALAPIGSSS